MNQSKQKMMKSKLKYYAQFIGINLLAALIPILMLYRRRYMIVVCGQPLWC
jgi:hypothetical protein|nr:MAG TPA: hypothetical protein [Caudoviricetes sp.]